MRKVMMLALLLLWITPSVYAEVDAFGIDQVHMYEGMARPYVQDYQPTISSNTARVVLPLLPGDFRGDIQAELFPQDIKSTPIKLSNKLTQIVKLRTYNFSGKKVSAYKVDFKLALYKMRLNGEYPFAIVIRGQNAEGALIEEHFDYVLRVSDGNPSDVPPIVSIDAFNVDDLTVGGKGNLRMTIVNNSASREVRNVLLSIADPSGEILPVGANTIKLNTLLPGASLPVNIPICALSKASAQPHALELTLSFSYGESRSVTQTEKQTVRLVQQVRLEHTEVQLPTQVTQGENVQFNLTLMNMGKGIINNALLTFNVPHMASGGSMLAGNIDPGKSASVTANLRVDSDYDGDTQGTLTLTWEDGYGAPYEKTLPLSTTVLKKAAFTNAVGVSTSEKNNASDATSSIREIIAWSLVAVLLVLYFAKVVFSNRRIRRLEEKQL